MNIDVLESTNRSLMRITMSLVFIEENQLEDDVDQSRFFLVERVDRRIRSVQICIVDIVVVLLLLFFDWVSALSYVMKSFMSMLAEMHTEKRSESPAGHAKANFQALNRMDCWSSSLMIEQEKILPMFLFNSD